MKDKLTIVLIISVIINFALIIFVSAYRADAENAQKINQDFFELGESIMEYDRCSHDLEINYRKGTEAYYNSDNFIEMSAAKSKMENIKTDILNKYGYQF